ncbi:MAG TPA: hypothetical protein VFM88_19375 [Vicinamibacteria bacterium]|nr:hypothetical protein [Vicinamibacteria bacterium]
MSDMVEAALVLLVALAAGAAGEDEEKAGVKLRVRGHEVPLSENERGDLAGRVEALIVDCGINSVSEPRIFAGRVLGQEWEKVLAGSHIYVRFSPPLLARRGDLRISEVAVGLDDSTFHVHRPGTVEAQRRSGRPREM